MILKTTLTYIFAMGLSLVLVQPVAAESRPKAGVLAAANGLVKARDTTDQNAQPRSLAVGGAVYFKDELITPEGVKAQILLKDQTTFALSGNAKMVLDEFVYDPKGKKNRVGASIAKGAFKFVSGKIAKQNTKNMKVKTGNVVVAVRGTEVIGNVQDQQTDVFLISGAIDVTSLASECLASPAAATNNPFAVGSDGNLALSSPPSASAPASCLQSIAQPGFKVVASVVGQISQPVRADPTEIENVINAVTIDPEEAEERTTDEQASDEQASDEQASDEQASDEQASDEQASDEQASDEQASDVATTEQDQTDESERQDAASTSQDSTEQQTADFGDAVVDLDANGQPKTDDSSRSTESEFDKLLIASITGTDDDQSAGSADDLTKTQVELDAFGVPKTDSASEPEREGDEKVTDSEQPLVGEDGKPVDSQAAIEEVKSEEVKDESLEAKSEEVASQYSLTVAALTDYQDTSASDTFSTQNQTATVSGTGSSTYGLSSSSASVRPGFDQEVAGSFGTLYLNTSTGGYEYVPNDSAINQLTTADGTKTDSFVFTASNGISSDSKTLNVAIKGVNDAPTFSLGTINDYAEDTAAADGGFSTQIASAQSISDAESDAVTFSISGGTGSSSEAGYTDSLLGSYGTLHLDSSTGGYKYIPDTGLMEATSATYTESFDIVATDGTSPATETLSFNVKGENDTPVFSNRSYGSWPRIAIVGQVWTGSANSNLSETVTDRDTDATGKVSKLDLTLVSGPSWLSVAPDGESLTGTPGGTGDGAAGQQVTIQASTEDDGGLASNTQTFTVNVCDSIGNCFLNPGDPDSAAEDRTVANFGGQDILNVSSSFISNTSNTYNVLQGAGLRGSFSGTSTTALEGVTTGGGGTLTTTQTVTVDFGAETAITTVTGEIDGIQKEGAFASGWVDGLRHTFSHTFGSISLQTGTVGGSSGTALRFEQDATTNVVGGNSNTIDIKAGWGIVESKFSTPSKPAVVGYVGVYSGGHSAETDTLRALSTDGSGTPIQKVIVLTPQ